MAAAPGLVTQLLVAWTNGKRTALEALIPAVYPELRRVGGPAQP